MKFDMSPSNVNVHESHVNLIYNSIRVIDKKNNWNILLFKEALAIKKHLPSLNNGLKASKDLQLF